MDRPIDMRFSPKIDNYPRQQASEQISKKLRVVDDSFHEHLALYNLKQTEIVQIASIGQLTDVNNQLVMLIDSIDDKI